MRYLLVALFLLPKLCMAETLEPDLDPAESVIFWMTLIFFFGVMGRYIAVRLKQPGVLGELLMGVLVGNLCYFFGLQLAVVLREGSAVFAIMRDLLIGLPLTQAIETAIPDPHYANQVLLALRGSQGIDLIKVAYVLDIFSRYGVIFLLFMLVIQ